jgi:hypothetical protein
MKRVAFTIVCSTILCTENVSPATDSIRVLLLDGQSARAYHNWQLTKRVLKKELEDTGRFQVTVATSPQSGGDFSNFAGFQLPAQPVDATLSNQLIHKYLN